MSTQNQQQENSAPSTFFGSNNLNQGLSGYTSFTGVKDLPRSFTGKASVSFGEAMSLLYRGMMIHSPSTMYKESYLALDTVDGQTVMVRGFKSDTHNGYKTEVITTVPTLCLLAHDWAIYIDVTNL